MRQARIRRLIARINSFDQVCQDDEYTDTGLAWDLLQDIRHELRKGLQTRASLLFDIIGNICIALSICGGLIVLLIDHIQGCF